MKTEDTEEITEEDTESAEPTEAAESTEPAEPAGSTEDGAGVRMSRTKRVLVIVLVLLVAGGAGGYFWAQANSLPEGVAFRVGDRDVSEEQLNQHAETLRALYGVQRPEEGPKLDRFRRDSAKSHAVSMILDDAARDRNVVIAEKTARDVLSRYIAQQVGDGPGAHDRFVQVLGNAGTSEQDVLTEIKRQLALSKLYDQVTKGQRVGDAELRRAFDNRRAQLGQPERRQLGNIVVRTKQEADQVLAELRSGKDFREVARARSLDASTRGSGGDLGEVRRDQLEAGYGKAAFGARPGEVYGPVRNKFGWNIGQVRRVLPPVPAEFEQSKARLRDTLTLEKATAVWRGWLRDRIAEADVEYAEKYRPADPTAAPGGAPR